MKGTRLQLENVDFRVDQERARCSADVLLQLDMFEYTGHFEAGIEEPPLRVIATATFDAINKALSASVGKTMEVALCTVGRMDPVFMDLPIFIVIVDVKLGERMVKPAGAVIAEHYDAYYAAAAASLDAVNRIVEKMLI